MQDIKIKNYKRLILSVFIFASFVCTKACLEGTCAKVKFTFIKFKTLTANTALIKIFFNFTLFSLLNKTDRKFFNLLSV